MEGHPVQCPANGVGREKVAQVLKEMTTGKANAPAVVPLELIAVSKVRKQVIVGYFQRVPHGL